MRDDWRSRAVRNLTYKAAKHSLDSETVESAKQVVEFCWDIGAHPKYIEVTADKGISFQFERWGIKVHADSARRPSIFKIV